MCEVQIQVKRIHIPKSVKDFSRNSRRLWMKHYMRKRNLALYPSNAQPEKFSRVADMAICLSIFLFHMSRRTTKPNKMTVQPVKTQISLGNCPLWSESLLSAWGSIGSLVAHKAQSEDSEADLSLAGRPGHFVGFVVQWLIWNRKMIRCSG